MAKPLSEMPRDIADRIARIDRDIQRARRETLRAAATVAKGAQEDQMRGDAGGDLTLSRVRSGRGARIGARYRVFDDAADLSAIGPLPLLANPTKPHVIPRQRRRRQLISIPGIGVRARANHSGTRGKDTWNVGREHGIPKVTLTIQRRTDSTVERSFRSGG